MNECDFLEQAAIAIFNTILVRPGTYWLCAHEKKLAVFHDLNAPTSATKVIKLSTFEITNGLKSSKWNLLNSNLIALAKKGLL